MNAKNKFDEIYESIIEIDTKGKEGKRRNSTKEPSIYSKKNEKNQILINKKKAKNIEEDINNRFRQISQLKKKEEKNSQNTNSLSIKNEENSENTNSLRKNSNNFSFKSYKTITPRNFILKSEIFRLNKINNSNDKTIYSDNKDINKLNIFSEKIENKEQSNQFNCKLFDKNDDNLKIESNTYEDIDENEEIENKFNLNKSLGMINIDINIKTSITNYYLNYRNKEDDLEEKLSMKNKYQNNYFLQNQNKSNMNFSGSVSPFNYQNNLNLFHYYNNNYNLYNYNNNRNMEMNNNIKYINNFDQKDFNKTNNNININNIVDINSFTSKNLLNLIKTQSGFQLLKEKSLNDHKFANEILFPKMKDILKDICIDFFGNCLMQTLLDILTYDNIDVFISYTDESLYDICLTEPGSRLIQKLIEKINSQPLLLNKFVFHLSNKNIGILFKSPYGNYILQKYLSIIKKKNSQIFYIIIYIIILYPLLERSLEFVYYKKAY